MIRVTCELMGPHLNDAMVFQRLHYLHADARERKKM